ncbi:MAG: 3-isopropylmalate dehydrogenase [Armatimonadota bacterium]|nr:3-isopropylmalate dehydrogenase [Armatimonadota bacterium]MDR7436572.1 3-isopropylmalate dehydrogenase [Armatimonadota bacterium]MDR7473116.1 3-isopropylmalate dehydrogenase [Armatimonadota bacterium]MDR7508070.1 3-isopropylmalate dehydrogenase [Armatimonadota bacterium]MDR7509181.1 3-isopropylmalate dehydrogenase [Armatimonadota bacterium]
MPAELRVALLPGDGIGPEVIRHAVAVLEAAGRRFGIRMVFSEAAVGGAALDTAGVPLPERTLEICRASDAVLLGAVGGPRWDHLPGPARPEAGLLQLRRALGVYANLRPVRVTPALVEASPLRPEVVAGTDLVIVRELTGGLYFGQPRGRTADGAVDTMRYSAPEVARVARVAMALARARRRKVTSVDKANVLETSRLWREVVSAEAAKAPDVRVEHMLVDTCALQLVRAPAQFDVVVTENMFGDILSDAAGAVAGSLGLLPSASLGDHPPSLYEPVHGSAPDLAGRGVANPVGAILSAALLLRHAAGHAGAARAVEEAVDRVLAAGVRTPDLGGTASTAEVGAAVVEAVGADEEVRR